MTRRTLLATGFAFLIASRDVAAQSGPQKRLGYLAPWAPPQPTTEPFRLRVRAAFPDALRGYGWIEGDNLIVERRFASGNLDLLPTLAAELVALNVDVILATTGRAGLAAKGATSSIPIVTSSGDMVRQGLVSNIARPDGNVTGQNVGSADVDIVAKRIQLLYEFLGSRPFRVAVLGCGLFGAPDITTNWAWPPTESAARTLHVQLRPYTPRSPTEINEALKDASAHAEGLLVWDCPYFNSLDAAMFLQHRLPAMYPLEAWAHRGGLMAYAFDEVLFHKRQAWYIDRILRGAAPADLPVEQAKSRFVINLETANQLRLKVPQALLLRADEVIP